MNVFSNLLSPNNKLTNFLQKLMYVGYLNLLWIITSLPLITIGASTTALYYTVLKIVRNEEGYIAKDYFRSFKQNFKQATKIWLIMLAVVFMLTINFFYFSSQNNSFSRIFSFLFLSLFFIFAIISSYIFPLLAQFHMTNKNLLWTAIILSLKNLHWSFCLTILFWCGFPLMVLRFYPLTVFGIPLIAFFQSYILNRIFKRSFQIQEFYQGEQIQLHIR